MNMSRATVELDFFGMDRDSPASSNSHFRNFIHRRASFPGIQSAISKIINPDNNNNNTNIAVLKTVQPENGVPLSSAKSLSVPTSPNADQNILFPSLPVYVPHARKMSNSPNSDSLTERTTTPLTIFYNGNVSVFEVPRDKAESIMRIVSRSNGNNKQGVESDTDIDTVVVDSKQPMTPLTINPTQLIDPNGDLPIARRKSLQRFLEKRKERLTSAVLPYGYGC